jgi:PPK2 family polyphosphate:nucleotide phosphotransferase
MAILINTSDFLASSDIELSSIPTRWEFQQPKKETKKQLEKVRRDLANFQTKLFAHNRHAVLCCFQGMDTSGKDSLIREVFKDFNVRGVNQNSFKVPTEKELSHGYLWRHYKALPPKGSFGIFNRTHYENVLVTRVHPQYLLSENLPNVHSKEDVTDDFWKMRFDQINNFESEIVQNGTYVFKFYLHLSKDEQKRRLLRRLDIPEKNWKFSGGDLKERALWDKYRYCYNQAIKNTHSDNSPWYIIPADDKPTARLIVASALQQELSKKLHIDFPTLNVEQTNSLINYRAQLEQE